MPAGATRPARASHRAESREARADFVARGRLQGPWPAGNQIEFCISVRGVSAHHCGAAESWAESVKCRDSTANKGCDSCLSEIANELRL